MTISAISRSRATRRPRGAFLALSTLVSGTLVALLFLGSAGAATPAILLGTADSFAILAGSGITNTGATSIAGDVGTFPTPSMTGFGTVTLDGVNHGGDAVTQQAKNDLTTAYNQAAASAPTTAVVTELGGKTLTPGVYGSDTLGITGTLTLDTLGDPYAVFVFQASTTLTTATDSAVVVLGGGEACNVFWQIGSSATLGTRSHLVGSVLAATSITATTGATIQGRLLARNGAVTLDHNTVTRAVCSATTTTTTADGATTVPTTEGTTPTTTPSDSTPTTVGSNPTSPEGGDTPAPADTVTPGIAAPSTPGTPADVPPANQPPANVPPSDVPPADVPPADAPPADVPPGSGAPRLPYTGGDAGGLTLVGLALIGFGGGAVYLSRRQQALGGQSAR